MKKVFLYAYDHVNLGDDLFIRTVLNRYPKVQFYIWSDGRNREKFSDLRNLTVIDKNAFRFRVLSKVRSSLVVRYQENLKNKCDAVIYIGGSIFAEYPTWKDIVNWWEYQASQHKFYVMGANFGPYKTDAYREEMDRVFSKLQDICFRDQYSYQLFPENEKVRVAPDILFSLADTTAQIRKKEIMISVISCKKKDEGANKLGEYHEAYIRYMITIAVQYMENGYGIIFTSFCEDEGDGEAIQEITASLHQSLPDKCWEILTYNGNNSGEILEKMRETEGIVATRFHAVILGIAQGTPVFPVIYSDKTKNVLNDLGFAGKYQDIRDLGDRLAEMPVFDRMQMLSDVEQLKAESAKHFEELDQILR